MDRNTLVDYLDGYLNLSSFRDYGPQGLQVEGRPTVRRVIGMVDAGYLAEAARLGCDLFITGETSHAQFHAAASEDLHVVYNGHSASETVGVRALGEHLAAELGLEFAFVDLPAGV